MAANRVISGAQILLAEGRTERVAQVVLTACEASDNYPHGLPGWAIHMVTRIPGGVSATMQLLRFRAASRAPGSWGWMSRRPVPREVIDDWFRPARTSAGPAGTWCATGTPFRTGGRCCAGPRRCGPTMARSWSSGPPRTG
jgi:hypothetical protein